MPGAIRLLLALSSAFISTIPITAQNCQLSKEANSISDTAELEVQEIPYFHAGEKGYGLIWDFSGLVPGEGSYNLWLQKDTLGRNVVLCNHGITYLSLKHDTLYVVGNESPLRKTDFNQPQLFLHYPLAYGDSLSAPFEGDGLYCGDHLFQERGTSTVMADAKGSIILDGDTIPNVLRVYTLKSYSICMGLGTDSAALDSARLKQVIEERYDWYARGYRYPLFTTITSTSYDDMTPIGTEQRAYCMLPDAQSRLSDPSHEDVHKKDSITNISKQNSEKIIHYSLVQNGNQIFMNYTLDEAACVVVLVTDVLGIVYRQCRQHHLEGEGYSMAIDLGGLHHGNYILYINVNGSIYNEKLTLK